MNNNELIEKWKIAFQNDKKILKKLSKMNELNDNDKFFTKLFFDNKKIIARIGEGYGQLNKLTVKLIAISFAKTLTNYKKEAINLDILISSDGSPEAKSFLEIIANVFESKGITSTAFKSYAGYDQKFVCRTIKKLNLDAGIMIEKSIFNDKVFNVFFINSEGIHFNKEFVEQIKLEMENHNIFEIKTNPAKTQFLSNSKVISDYVGKVLSLSNRKGDQKKIKIAISNYNSSVTQILKKILGNMDFNYVVNNNLNKGNIHQKKKINKKTYSNFYWRDIIFSKKNKCSMLICPSKNGSQLNLFVSHGRNFVYLDSNEITLMFLNFFLINMNIGSKKITNSYIGTDIPPIQSVKNIINKYNLELLITGDVEVVENKYLLFYWNQESQFIFGENKIIEFGFHHLIIRFLEMLNYYETQRLNIYSQKNILIKMYGHYTTHTIILNFDLYKLNFWLDNIYESNTNKKYPIDIVTRYQSKNILNQNLIAKVSLKSGIELFIKFNYINRKIIIYIRLEDEQHTLLNKNKFVQNVFISKINSTIKNDLKKFL